MRLLRFSCLGVLATLLAGPSAATAALVDVPLSSVADNDTSLQVSVPFVDGFSNARTLVVDLLPGVNDQTATDNNIIADPANPVFSTGSGPATFENVGNNLVVDIAQSFTGGDANRFERNDAIEMVVTVLDGVVDVTSDYILSFDSVTAATREQGSSPTTFNVFANGVPAQFVLPVFVTPPPTPAAQRTAAFGPNLITGPVVITTDNRQNGAVVGEESPSASAGADQLLQFSTFTISAVVIPEPSSMLMLACFGLLGFRRVR